MLKPGFSLNDLQNYIKEKDFNPEQRMNYFYKLIEEVGELSEVMRKDKRLVNEGDIKGTIEEELYDVLYYTVALANIYDISLENCTLKKEEINQQKWKTK